MIGNGFLLQAYRHNPNQSCWVVLVNVDEETQESIAWRQNTRMAYQLESGRGRGSEEVLTEADHLGDGRNLGHERQQVPPASLPDQRCVPVSPEIRMVNSVFTFIAVAQCSHSPQRGAEHPHAEG